MWRTIRIFLFGSILGTGFGVAVGLVIFPYVFPPPPANEVLTEAETTRVVARGQFIHANPNDPIHYGSGAVTVYQRTVFLGSDFEVGPGPKFHVYLAPNATVRQSGDVAGTMFIDLGRLRAFKEIRRSRRRRSGRLSKRGYLVRTVRSLDLAGGPVFTTAVGRAEML